MKPPYSPSGEGAQTAENVTYHPAAEAASDAWPDEPLTPESMGRLIEAVSPSSLAAHLDPSRPYDGQPHTDHGERGKTEVRGITFRDLRDCFIRACYESSGLPIERWPGSVHDLPWDDMDIVAVAQNLSCNVEKAMGIFPNVPRLLPTDPTEPHWCGHPLERAEWLSHDGPCREDGQPKASLIQSGPDVSRLRATVPTDEATAGTSDYQPSAPNGENAGSTQGGDLST